MIALPAGALTIEILDGNIADQAVDAVVNAANNHFWMGSGVAGALKARGGPEVETEAMAQGPVKPGECVVTHGGRLPARWVVHAAVMGQDLATSAPLIAAATRNSLAAAAGRGAASIAFPAFGTGVGGFPIDACARLMLGEVKASASAPGTLRLVRFVLFGRPAYDAFVSVASELFPPP